MNKFFSYLTLAMKAGKIKSGEFACEKSIQTGEAVLVLIAGDASENTKKRFNNKAFYYNIPVLTVSTKDEISKYIGKSDRAVLTIIDEGFARKMTEIVQRNNV